MVTRLLFAASVLAGASSAAAAADQTDFGVRTVGPGPSVVMAASSSNVSWAPVSAARISLSAIASIGAQWGRVTSTLRSPEHNRRVGGVRNSYHLRGRAIDIARRPGVSHGQIAAAFRSAGYHLVESLDEGDHSHFAFGTGRPSTAMPTVAIARKAEQAPSFKIVMAPGALR